jgi:outer membrane protein OmpA-like peptidoglycan-associated protein
MRWLAIGVAAGALLTPLAEGQAQTSPAVVAPAGSAEATSFAVFFGFDSAELDAAARQVVAEAAAAYRQSGEAQVSVIGHTDTSGPADYNLRLSERRAEAVQAALIREGVPATSIVTIARGQEDLLVPTADGVRQPENRRVEILVPRPSPAPAPVAELPPEPAPPPVEPEPEQPDRWTFALGPVYGHNFGEKDRGGKKTENDLVGAELVFRALPGVLGGVSLKQMGLWSFNGSDNGLTGRSVASLDFSPDLGIFRPSLAINGGGVYGKGVQDGFVVGPEIRFDVAPVGGFNIGLKAAYDYQFRNAGWDEGILWGGLDLGIRF